MGPFVLVPILTAMKKPYFISVLFTNSFHEPLKFRNVQGIWIFSFVEKFIVERQRYKTIIFVHLSFMHTAYCPLTAVIQPAANTLATGQIKTLCESKGFIKYHLAIAFESDEGVITGHLKSNAPSHWFCKITRFNLHCAFGKHLL